MRNSQKGGEHISILNFAPENGFYEKIQQGIKIGTIRDKPKVVGETLHLWEKKRGMKKGYYCVDCLKLMEPPNLEICQALCKNCNKTTERILLPRKIAEKRCTSCYRLDMRWGLDGSLELHIPGYPPEKERELLTDIVTKEGFDNHNQMLFWFAQHGKMREGRWYRKFWIRWD